MHKTRKALHLIFTMGITIHARQHLSLYWNVMLRKISAIHSQGFQDSKVHYMVPRWAPWTLLSGLKGLTYWLKNSRVSMQACACETPKIYPTAWRHTKHNDAILHAFAFHSCNSSAPLAVTWTDPEEPISVKFQSKYRNFPQRKYI